MELEREALRRTVAAALAEDLGAAGDVTTDALLPEGQRATAHIVARSDLILAGLAVAREVFRQLDPELEFVAHRRDAERVGAGERVATLRGEAHSMLRGERTALNFLMRMCGIATAARSAVTETAETGARILDTRKTAPGLRRLDKYAVAAGGALNHRLGLYDAVMIKDTHLGVVGSVAGAVARARAAGHPADRITVEVRDVEQLRQAIESGAGRALLDNMDPVALREAVKIGGGRIVLEASGGLRPGALRAIAESGVDYLSIGYLTHSAPAADLAMEMEMSS
jgi:nicotinate-nucleotide pyrophosphorylase (carboxylating)